MKRRSKIILVLLSILAIAFGIFLFIYGEYDDSPGGQLLGLLMVVLGAVGIVKAGRSRLGKNSQKFLNK